MWSLKILLCSIIGCLLSSGSFAFQATPDSASAQRSAQTSAARRQNILSPPRFYPQHAHGHSEHVFRFRQPLQHEYNLMTDVDDNLKNAKTVADKTSQTEDRPLAISDWSVALILLLVGVVGGYVISQKVESLQQEVRQEKQQEDMQEDMQEQADQEKDIQIASISSEDTRADSQESEVFSPVSTSTSTSIHVSISSSEQVPSFGGLPVRGTQTRMDRLPPTANPSMMIRPQSKHKSWSSSKKSTLASISESAQVTATDCRSSSSESSMSFLPPALSPDFAESCGDGDCLWTILPHQLHAFDIGSPLQVQGSPPLYARLATNAGGETRLEMGTAKDFIAADVIIGPLSPCSSAGVMAELIGPGGQVYGSFSGSGDFCFRVTHRSRNAHVLSLDPVTTNRGSFLEVAAEGHPVCLVNLNDPGGAGIEIGLDPDIDAFLIVSCVLASLVAAPELRPAISAN